MRKNTTPRLLEAHQYRARPMQPGASAHNVAARFALALVLALSFAAGLRAQAAGTPVLQVSAINGTTVVLRWVPAPGPAAEAFVVEGGVVPGQILASVPVAGSASSLSLSLAPGVYFARVHAIHGGIRGAASNEVRLSVGVAELPAAPAAFEAVAIGSDVSLSWRAGLGGGAPVDMVVEVTGPLMTALPVAPNGTVAFGGIPDGTYTLSMRARNGAGVSAPLTTSVAVPGLPVRHDVAPALPADAARMPVRYENYTAPRLRALMAREGLGAVAGGAASEFAAILQLKEWVAAQFPVGSPAPYPPWDAMTVLDWIRAGITGGFCGQYAQVFLQSLAAFGVPARYVEIGHGANPYNHFATEVWSDDFNKWMLLDAHFNSYFARHGVPLSALEVRDALLENTLNTVDVVLGSVRAGHPSPYEFPQRTAELFYYLRYHLNANHVSAPGEAPFDRLNDMVEFLDGRTVPWELSTVPSEFPHERLTVADTGDRRLVEWKPNQLWLSPRRVGVLQYAVDLQHSMLAPSYIEYRVVDRAGVAGPWTAHPGPGLIWNATATDRLFEVRAVNVMGRRGPVSSLRIGPS